MSFACETEIGVQNELALRFSIVIKPTPVLEYVKTISSLVGASHILAVFEEADTLKVFFDDRVYINTLIQSGIHVMGHHVRVDYVVPPGTKVLLSNVDPIVSNYDISRLLSNYGSIVSPIIRPAISDDMEFCHIVHGDRFCYMTISDPIPPKLVFKYGDQLCQVQIKVGEEFPSLPFIKSDESSDQQETDFTNNDDFEVESCNDCDVENTGSPVVVSVESASDLHPLAKSPKRRPIKRRRRAHKPLKVKQTKVTATTRAAKKIKRNVKNKWIGAKRIQQFRKGKRSALMKKTITHSSTLRSQSSSIFAVDTDDVSSPQLLINLNKRSVGSMSEEKLLEFIEECKHNRTPVELVKKYLGNDYSDDALHHLIEQIESHSKNSSCQSLKLRLGRLCKSLSESVNTES